MEYGLIGEKLPHSFSKEIHRQFGNYEYCLCEIAKQNLTEFMEKRQFRGINVTIPYKQAVIPYLDFTDQNAERIGAVNTVVHREGKLYGYNTDYDGLKGLILKNNICLTDRKVLILGTGGTSNTAFYVAGDLNASQILKVSRTKQKEAITYEDALVNHTDADVIINTTPVGMFPDSRQTPLEIKHFSKLSAVVDVIYHPLRSRLVLEADEMGIPSVGGMYMLVLQGASAAEHFLSDKICSERIDSAFQTILNQKQNIVLIGMPSSGKTTAGQKLARKLNRRLFDTDSLIEEKTGQTIPEFFLSHSEEEFRAVETEVIKEISSVTGSIIATGGGSVLKKENVQSLKQNGKLYFLNRPLNMLTPTNDRPLSQNADDIKKRFQERYEIYKHAADAEIISDGTVWDTVSQIERDFYENNDNKRTES